MRTSERINQVLIACLRGVPMAPVRGHTGEPWRVEAMRWPFPNFLYFFIGIYVATASRPDGQPHRPDRQRVACPLGSPWVVCSVVRGGVLRVTAFGYPAPLVSHHLGGALKRIAVPLGIAQEILGHSSGSITFDLYGSGRAVQVTRMSEALRDALTAG